VVAWALASDRRLRRGLVLVNGEFGRRIAAQAGRAGLQTTVLAWDWGRPWDLLAVQAALEQDNRLDWVWGVHLESSTGMLNDVGGLLALLRERRVRAVLDAVSRLRRGAAGPLARVTSRRAWPTRRWAAWAGLSFVQARAGPSRAWTRPRAVQPRPARGAGHARPALHHGRRAVVRDARGAGALRGRAPRRERFASYLDLGRTVRTRLAALGMPALVGRRAGRRHHLDLRAAAGPARGPARGGRCGRLHAGRRQRLLRERGWLQIATMGEVAPTDVERLFRGSGAGRAR